MTAPVGSRSIPEPKALGFSLVEVTLAIGVITFAIITVVALFGSLMDRERQIAEKRAAAAALPALHSHLSDNMDFASVFDLVAGGRTATLNYVTFRADAGGLPQPEGNEVGATWLAAAQDSAPYEAARLSRWIRAELTLDTNLNPTNTLPAQAGSYTNAEMSLRARLFPVADPRTAIPSGVRPALTAPIVVRQ